MKKDANRKQKIKKQVAAGVSSAVICVLLFAFIFQNVIIDRHVHYVSDEPMMDLQMILKKDHLTEEDYEVLKEQTGLGTIAVDAIIRENKRQLESAAAILTSYQKDYLAKKQCVCERIGWVTKEERMQCNEKQEAFQIFPIKNGDVLISLSTHTAGWRHGHAALVIDERKGELLEATLWNEPVTIKHVEDWQDYATFVLLRPKETLEVNGDEIADFARENLLGVPYGLLSGVPNKMPKHVSKTQCAHLVWCAYRACGVDIDSDGGWLVTPHDILYSDCFDVVQVYGMNPNIF